MGRRVVSPSFLVNCRREPCVVLLGLHLYRSCNINPLFSALFKHPVVQSVSFKKSSMCGGWVVVVCVVERFGGENPFYWKQQGFVVEKTQKMSLPLKGNCNIKKLCRSYVYKNIRTVFYALKNQIGKNIQSLYHRLS